MSMDYGRVGKNERDMGKEVAKGKPESWFVATVQKYILRQ